MKYRVILETKDGVLAVLIIDGIKAPLCTSKLIGNIPSKCRVYRIGEGLVEIPLGASSILEKPTTRVEVGDVFYSPSTKSIYIALKSQRLTRRVTILGRLEHDEYLHTLRNLKEGLRVNIKVEAQ
ncbi:MAG: hypothetical protein DRJ49_00400 [Thermoprotei archaeon]|nr:MAG: hypothetical protein DRN53_05140 [Thermoprotei archaeon]RLE90270.1 MAG: hypothetical protein DRJ49_00400 [Thermoprotei archaeon]RLI82401.1 MAG: hypothetical protein DRP01_09950 [Archaeoglobales archaeon]